jgi:hypothetical protein
LPFQPVYNLTGPFTAYPTGGQMTGAGNVTFALLQNGTLVLVKALDFETTRTYNLVVSASDGALRTLQQVSIVVGSVNDVTPAFTEDVYTVTVAENLGSVSSPHFLSRVLSAVDADPGTNGLSYAIESLACEPACGSGLIVMDPTDGAMRITRAFDYEVTHNVTLQVSAIDSWGAQSLTGFAVVVVVITNENDNAPRFVGVPSSGYASTVVENTAVGLVILDASAVDLDGDTLVYSLVGGNGVIVINSATGRVSLSAAVNREVRPVITAVVVAVDPGNRSATTPITITVTDQNDNAPEFQAANPGCSAVNENSAVGTVVLTTVATDADAGSNGSVSYALLWASSRNGLAVNSATGAVTVAGSIDYETTTEYLIDVIA